MAAMARTFLRLGAERHPGDVVDAGDLGRESDRPRRGQERAEADARDGPEEDPGPADREAREAERARHGPRPRADGGEDADLARLLRDEDDDRGDDGPRGHGDDEREGDEEERLLDEEGPKRSEVEASSSRGSSRRGRAASRAAATTGSGRPGSASFSSKTPLRASGGAKRAKAPIGTTAHPSSTSVKPVVTIPATTSGVRRGGETPRVSDGGGFEDERSPSAEPSRAARPEPRRTERPPRGGYGHLRGERRVPPEEARGREPRRDVEPLHDGVDAPRHLRAEEEPGSEAVLATDVTPGTF